MKGRRLLERPAEAPERPGWRDYFQMVTTALMVILGTCILWQTLFARWAFPSLIFSVALLLFGLFRIRMIWNYFRGRRKRYGS